MSRTVSYSADIAGLEREFGRALTKLPLGAPLKLDEIIQIQEEKI